MDRLSFPVLYQRQRFVFVWNPQAPEACACVRRIYHTERGKGACPKKAAPRREMRVIIRKPARCGARRRGGW